MAYNLGMLVNNRRKKTKAGGGFLVDNASAIGGAGQLAGSLVDTFAPEDSMGGGIASGALKGGASLAALGPYGMAAGAIVGGTVGAINAKKAQQLSKDRAAAKTAASTALAVTNAGNTFKHGGQLLAKSLSPVDGGSLEAISDDAVVVNADNPNETDSVELNNAYVDDNEVIDKENRVFSDSVFLPNGKSIAKEAKRLEKMKAEDYEFRFKKSNEHIEGKLNKLFEYQEAMKNESKTAFSKGGTITMSKSDFKSEHNRLLKVLKKGDKESLHEEYEKQSKEMKEEMNTGGRTKVSFKKGGKIVEFFAKPKLKSGGPVDPWVDSGLPAEETTIKSVGSGPKLDTASNSSAISVDPNTALTQAATFAPNAVNAILQKRLKTSPAPQLETQLKLKRVSADPQLAANTRGFRSAQKQLSSNVGQASDLMAGTGNLLAKKLAADNEAIGQTNYLNASIASNEAGMNQAIKVRNVERTNAFRDSVANLANKKLQMTSENVSNLGTKILQQGAEKNMIDKDKLALEILGKKYEDSGVYKRQIDQIIKDYQEKKGYKKGGKIKLNIRKKK